MYDGFHVLLEDDVQTATLMKILHLEGFFLICCSCLCIDYE